MKHKHTHTHTRRGVALGLTAAFALAFLPATAVASEDDIASAQATLTAPGGDDTDAPSTAPATDDPGDLDALAGSPVTLRSDATWDLFHVLNTARIANGREPLVQHAGMNAVATNWAGTQAARGTYSLQRTQLEAQLTTTVGVWADGYEGIFRIAASSTDDAITRLAETYLTSTNPMVTGAATDIGLAVAQTPYYGTVSWYTLYLVSFAKPHTVARSGELTMYRFFRPDTGTHFYTTTAAERNSVAKNPGYRYEGQVAYVLQPSSTTTGTTALNRFYTPPTGTHFYTASQTEYARVLTYPQYTLDGVAAKVYANQATGTVPMYRFFRPDTGTHFYSASTAEVAAVKQMPGYRYEGVAYFLRIAS